MDICSCSNSYNNIAGVGYNKVRLPMQMTRETFHAYLGTMEYDDYIVRYKYKYAFEKDWSYQNVIYLFNGDDMTYEIQGDIDEGQEEIYIIGYVPVSAIDCAALTILPLTDVIHENTEPESEDENDNA